MHPIFDAFFIVLQIQNIYAGLIGVIVGTLTGVLPGLGPVGAMALLFPVAIGMDSATALILLTGVYYGAMYGGSTTAILLNIPGESASVVTCIDGYRMARKGRAGAALAVAAVGSFVAGTLGTVALMYLAPPLARFAVRFGPPEFFAIAFFGLLVLSTLSPGSLLKSWAMIVLGLMIGTFGIDVLSGTQRITYGTEFLMRGVDFIPVIMGVYGVTEVLYLAEELSAGAVNVIKVKFRELFPTQEEWKRSTPPILRGSVVGFFAGLIPGPATVIASFASYALEKRVSRHRHELGTGAIEGVAGPESANNSATSGAMVPLLALGVPFSPAAAMLLGALLVHGVIPGPMLAKEHPQLLWTVIASMYTGNVLLLILNYPLVGLFANILRVPARIIAPCILIFCILGAYAVNNSVMDIQLMVIFGLVGYVMRKGGYDAAPLVLAIVLGPMMESSLRQSFISSQGDPFILITRPISGTILACASPVLLWPLINRFIRKSTPPPESALEDTDI